MSFAAHFSPAGRVLRAQPKCQSGTVKIWSKTPSDICVLIHLFLDNWFFHELPLFHRDPFSAVNSSIMPSLFIFGIDEKKEMGIAIIQTYWLRRNQCDQLS